MTLTGEERAEVSGEARRPVVLVVHASVGSGHRTAANAVAESLEALRGTGSIPVDADVRVLDILDFGRIRFDGNKAASAFTGATRPIYDITWRYVLTGRLLWGGGSSWSQVMFPAFSSYVRETRPLCIVTTHIVAANAAVGARMVTGVEYPVVCVPTDYEVEGFWPHREADLFCVGTEFMAETLRARHVEEDRILVTGIPVRRGFTGGGARERCLARFGLPVDKLIVLVMAGASLPQPYVRFRAAIEQTLPYLRRLDRMHFVFLPGRDTAYAEKLRSVFAGMALPNATVLDYVEDMPALMRAAHAAVLKPGGLTVTECLCTHLPMILLGRAYGQERANTVMLSSFGACIQATTARELVVQLERLHDNPEVRRALLVNAAMLCRPQAGDDIARAACALVGEPRARRRRFIELYWGDRPAHAR